MALNRSKSRYSIKECSTCGSWYTKECCSIGNLKDQIIVPVSDSFQHCAVCGTPVDGPYCHGCALIRKKFEKKLFAYCVDNRVFQNLQDTSESSDDNTNVVNALREPSVVDQDPGVNISQDPPQIDHNCCYECGDSLNGIFCQKCICQFCGKGAHFGYNCPPKDPIISEPEPFYSQNFDCVPHDSQILPQQYFCCENCGGPHETYQCQPMNQEYFYSHSSGFDQFQPPQFSDVYHTPPVASMEMLHAQADLIESMQSFLMKYDHIPHNEKSIKLLLAEEKFLKIKQVVEEEQTQPEYLQELLQSLLKDLQILNEIQPLKQEIPNQIQKDQRKKIEDMSIEEMIHEQQLVDREIKEIINDLGYKRFRGEEIDEEYERDCEITIQNLKQDFNIWGSEVRKKEKAYEDEKYAAACRYMLSVTCDDDDDDDLGFYAVHPNTIHTPVSQNTCSSCSDFTGNRWKLCRCDDTDDVDDDAIMMTIFYDCVDIEEDEGEIDFDISKIVDISLREKLVEKEADLLSFSDNSITRGIESDRDSGEDTTSIDDLPLDDSMILPEYESFTFDDEPVMAEVNVFDEINTSELSYPGIGENVVSDEEEDTFKFTTRSFLPFVTYPEVLPVSYSTGSEDKVFMVFRILEASWFNIVEGQSNSHNFHRWSPIFSS
ncbi:hypothetical protein Tco_0729064 [Tanacetum coccineum]|uniref:Uncharacterized protein n=1 Tax=Tanacetum coccineum TaxID=301880 RepID=A0ABQ4YMX6_9ASTR